MKMRFYPVLFPMLLGLVGCAAEYSKSEAPTDLRVDGAESRRDLRKPGDALACLDRALRLRPHNADAHFMRGLILADLNNHDESLASFRQALRHCRGHAKTCDYLGITHALRGQ